MLRLRARIARKMVSPWPRSSCLRGTSAALKALAGAASTCFGLAAALPVSAGAAEAPDGALGGAAFSAAAVSLLLLDIAPQRAAHGLHALRRGPRLAQAGHGRGCSGGTSNPSILSVAARAGLGRCCFL